MRLPRRLHKMWASLAGYFWLPCPLCGEMFGGHEWKVFEPNSTIMTSWHTATGICPNCHEAAKEYNDKWMEGNPRGGQQMDNGNFVESVLSPLQPILSTMYTQRIEKDHERALIENKTRIRDWATIGEGKKARLTGISRGFGGDNAFYESSVTYEGKTTIQKITVCVGWGMPAVWRSAYNTTVLIDEEVVAEFNDLEYIQPHVALARLGYVVHGTVDFAEAVSPE